MVNLSCLPMTPIYITAKTKSLAYKTANEILAKVSNYMQANKLHINMGKCCYIHFSPENTLDVNDDQPHHESPALIINNIPIKQVTQTKFLGIVIDHKLSWTHHIKQLRKLLAYCTGSLNRVRSNVKPELYKNLYHTLYESYLSYGITVWGDAPESHLSPLLVSQKNCCRILLGDRDAYNDKFKTCARTRPKGEQILGEAFFRREHTKPLMNKNSILILPNLYQYHSSLLCLKILKFRTPISI